MDDLVRLAEIQAAGKRLGVPYVITQYTKDRDVKHQVACLRVGPLAMNEGMLFALEGDLVQGFVYLADIRGLRVEQRRSFKHPIIGLILGGALLALPLLSIVGAVVELPWAPKADRFVCAETFMAAIGGYTVWEVLRNRQVPFLIVDTKDGPRVFELHGGVTAEVQRLIAALQAAISPAVIQEH